MSVKFATAVFKKQKLQSHPSQKQHSLVCAQIPTIIAWLDII